MDTKFFFQLCLILVSAFVVTGVLAQTATPVSVPASISDGSTVYAWVGVSKANPVGYWLVYTIDPASPHELLPTVKKIVSNSDPRSAIPMP